MTLPTTLARIARCAIRIGARALVLALGSYALLDVVFPLPADAFRPLATSPVVRASDGHVLRVGLSTDGERVLSTPPRGVSPHLVNALIAVEDRRFYVHTGVDPHALLRAAAADLARGHLAEGGSTITMQLARLVDPQPRTMLGKLVQMFRALQIERTLTKDEILARYLERAPFGGALRGAEATARAWFGKSAATLSAAEAALLVSVLPSPTRFNPRRDAAGARARRDRVLAAMAAEGFLDERSRVRACAEPVELTPEAFPLVAPHVVARMGEGTTSVDAGLEARVEALASLVPAPDGVAIVVLDVETGRVRALAGATAADARVLDATSRARSAGSTLKPFLYALAFDRGLASPLTTLLDLPFGTADWEPSNFDRSFRGPVSASEALSSSLNLPAIRLAASMPDGQFVDALAALGFARVRTAGRDRALDLAIGTDDVTPMELCAAYATLARGGEFRAPTLSDGGVVAPGRRVLSRGACELVTRMLADSSRQRPIGAPFEGVAWKTGTSSRRRDAWAAGFTSSVAAVVWRGRLDGAPDASLVGAEAASPLLFDVLALADPAPRPFAPPTDVVDVEVCAETGCAAGSACPDRRRDVRPRDAAPLAVCATHVRIEVDRETGQLLCPRCRARHAALTRDVALRAPVLAEWRARQGFASSDLPPHADDCETPLESAVVLPVIVSPRSGRAIESVSEAGASVSIRVLAPDAASTLVVLVDGESIGRVPSGVACVRTVARGRHRLTAITASGRRTTVPFEVVAVP